MCGRYFQYGTKEEIAGFVRPRRITAETIAPDYNASPTTCQPILRVDRETGERELVLMDWSKQKYLPAYATINARGERLLESNMWKTFMRKGQRCCAVMSGFQDSRSSRWSLMNLRLALPLSQLTISRMHSLTSRCRPNRRRRSPSP